MRDDDLTILDQINLDKLQIRLDLHTRQRVKVDRYTAFSWSTSRRDTFERCRRQYYLQYYGSRRVMAAKDKIISAVFWLKQVATRRTWIGSVIHMTAQEAIKGVRDGKPWDEEQVRDYAIEYYRGGARASERGVKFDNQWVSLFEDVYPGDPASIDRNEAEQTVIDLAQTFYESDAYALIQNTPPTAIREVDESFQSFMMSGILRLGKVRVFAIPDVLLFDGQQATIIDWKTGSVEHEGIRNQAGVYRLYVHHTYNLPEEAIHVQIVDLGNNGETVEPPGGAPTLAEAEQYARESMAEMIGLMEDVTYNTVTIKNFPRTDEVAKCQWCGFKAACWRRGAEA